MIFVYPMLVSNTVSREVLPMISKVLERYILLYRLDEITTGRSLRGKSMREYLEKGTDPKILFEDFREFISDEGNFLEDPANYENLLKEESDDWDYGGGSPSPKMPGPSYKQRYEELKREVERLKREVENRREDPLLDKKEKKLDRENRKLKKDVEKIKQDMKKSEQDMKKSEQDMKKSEQDIKKSEADIRKTEEELRRLQRTYGEKAEELRKELRQNKDLSRDDRNKIKADIKKNQEMQDQIEETEIEKLRKLKQDNDKTRVDIAKSKLELKQKQAEIKKAEQEAGKSTFRLDKMDLDSLALEPTWFVSLDKDGHQRLVGVKVVPVNIKSDAQLINIMTYDVNANKLHAMAISFGRSIIRKFYRTLLGKIVSKKEPIGRARNDILIRRSKFKEGIFAVINKLDFDHEFFNSPKNINQLFKMGWADIIIMDDINKRAHFCMRSYAGICTTLTYMMMFSTVKQSKTFESIEDVKRSSSSLFRVRTPMKKVVLESYLDKTLEKYFISDSEG